jgi:hypothetical protein
LFFNQLPLDCALATQQAGRRGGVDGLINKPSAPRLSALPDHQVGDTPSQPVKLGDHVTLAHLVESSLQLIALW